VLVDALLSTGHTNHVMKENEKPISEFDSEIKRKQMTEATEIIRWFSSVDKL
jgi:hypothetical protein